MLASRFIHLLKVNSLLFCIITRSTHCKYNNDKRVIVFMSSVLEYNKVQSIANGAINC